MDPTNFKIDFRSLGEFLLPYSSSESSREPSPHPKATHKTTGSKINSEMHRLADDLLLEMALEAKERPLEKALHEKNVILLKTEEELKEAKLTLVQTTAQLEEAMKVAQMAQEQPCLNLKVEILEAVAPLELQLQEEQATNMQLRAKNTELLTSLESLKKEIKEQSEVFEKAIIIARDKTVEIARSANETQESLETHITSLKERIETLSQENRRLLNENTRLIQERETVTSDYLSDHETRFTPSSHSVSSLEEQASRSGASPTEFISDPLPTSLQDELAIYKEIVASLRFNLEEFGSSDHQKTQALLNTLKRLVSQAPTET